MNENNKTMEMLEAEIANLSKKIKELENLKDSFKAEEEKLNRRRILIEEQLTSRDEEIEVISELMIKKAETADSVRRASVRAFLRNQGNKEYACYENAYHGMLFRKILNGSDC